MKKEIKIHRIETRDSSNILTTTMGAFKYSEIRFKPDVNFNAHHLYATVSQEVEPIKEGDWYYNNIGNRIYKCNDSQLYEGDSRKIIATTDKKLTVTKSATGYTETRSRTFTSTKPITGVQQSFIKEYCDKGGIDKALVEYERNFDNRTCDSCNLFDKSCELKLEEKCCTATKDVEAHGDYWISRLDDENDAEIYTLKLNSDNTITIYPLEENITLTRAQLKHILHCATGNVKDFVMDNDGFITDWIKENL